jgi:hypothetical protein
VAWISVHYAFRQRFPLRAERAFRWCVDYRAEDLELEGLNGRRRVRWLADDLVGLTDTVRESAGRPVTKTRLVRIRPPERAWTSTHLSGPNRHSQFWYRIEPDGRSGSHLRYEALHVERRTASPSPSAMRALARRLAREDAAAWRRLASAMETDLR